MVGMPVTTPRELVSVVKDVKGLVWWREGGKYDSSRFPSKMGKAEG